MKELKNLRCANIMWKDDLKDTDTYLTFERRTPRYSGEKRNEIVKNTFPIYECRKSNKTIEWPNICFHDSICKIYPDIVKIEIWYNNGELYGLIKDTVVVTTKKLNISFDQFRIDGSW